MTSTMFGDGWWWLPAVLDGWLGDTRTTATRSTKAAEESIDQADG